MTINFKLQITKLKLLKIEHLDIGIYLGFVF